LCFPDPETIRPRDGGPIVKQSAFAANRLIQPPGHSVASCGTAGAPPALSAQRSQKTVVKQHWEFIMSWKLLPHTAAASLLLSTAALAQTTKPPAGPADRVPPPAATAPADTAKASPLTLTDAEAKHWIDKNVYSSDGRSIGEVGAIQRDATGKVTELHADIGGFLGIGQTRVKVMPDQFRLSSDRVVLKMTADQVKSLPKVAKAN
jgi:hypothetical protein